MIYDKQCGLIIFHIYSDDILVTENNNNFITTIVNSLNSVFTLKYLGTFSYFLGIETTKNNILLSFVLSKVYCSTF